MYIFVNCDGKLEIFTLVTIRMVIWVNVKVMINA